MAVRSGPGLDEELLGRLPSDYTAFVISGPLQADDRPWYLLAGLGMPSGTGCTLDPSSEMIPCPGWTGWVAAASASGTPWLQPTDLGCPTLNGQDQDLGTVPYGLRLYCYGGDTFSLQGFLRVDTDCPVGGITPESLACAGSGLFTTAYGLTPLTLGPELGSCSADWPSDSGCSAASFAGEWVRASLTVDHPAAAGCGGAS